MKNCLFYFCSTCVDGVQRLVIVLFIESKSQRLNKIVESKKLIDTDTDHAFTIIAPCLWTWLLMSFLHHLCLFFKKCLKMHLFHNSFGLYIFSSVIMYAYYVTYPRSLNFNIR